MVEIGSLFITVGLRWPCKIYRVAFARKGEHQLICAAVTGIKLKWFSNKIVSPGTGTVDGTSGKGKWLHTSAWACLIYLV